MLSYNLIHTSTETHTDPHAHTHTTLTLPRFRLLGQPGNKKTTALPPPPTPPLEHAPGGSIACNKTLGNQP